MGSGPYRPRAPIGAELASGAVVVARKPGPPAVALLHQREDDRWCLPKGHVDPGESLEATAVREVREETGLTVVVLGEELAEVSYRFYSPKKGANVQKVIVYFLASTAETVFRPEPIFDRAEWVGLETALGRVRFDTDRTVLGAAVDRLSSPRETASVRPKK